MVEVNKLRLGYDGDAVIKEARFNFHKDDFVFVTGKSGSGKSTLLKSLYGELEPMGGSVKVCKVLLNKIGTKELLEFRQKIGIIFQDYRLISEFSVEKNVMLPLMIKGYSKEVCKDQATKLLKHVQLTFKANKKPIQLSGGEQQRAAMARALAHNPKLLLCDEPTGNLDEYSSDIIWTLLKSARELLGTCVVVATHSIPKRINLQYRAFEIKEGKINELL